MSKEKEIKPGDVISKADFIRATVNQGVIVKADVQPDGSRVVTSVTPAKK